MSAAMSALSELEAMAALACPRSPANSYGPQPYNSEHVDERLDALMEKKYRVAEDFLKPLDSEDKLAPRTVLWIGE